MAGLRGALLGGLGLVALQVAVTEADRGNTRLERLVEAPGAVLRWFMSADRPGLPDKSASATAADTGPQVLAPGPIKPNPLLSSAPSPTTPRLAWDPAKTRDA